MSKEIKWFITNIELTKDEEDSIQQYIKQRMSDCLVIRNGNVTYFTEKEDED